MAVAEAWDHQQVTLRCPGTQHPLFWPIPTPLSPRLWLGLALSRGKPWRPLLECGLGAEGGRGIEVIRAGGVSLGQGCALCTTRTPQGRALCVLCPKLQAVKGPPISSSPWVGLGRGAPPRGPAWPCAVVAAWPFSPPSGKPLRGDGGGEH